MRPSGAKRTAVGNVSPLTTVVSENPGGITVPCADVGVSHIPASRRPQTEAALSPVRRRRDMTPLAALTLAVSHRIAIAPMLDPVKMSRTSQGEVGPLGEPAPDPVSPAVSFAELLRICCVEAARAR